jgi:hypothetical protein
MPLFSRNFEGRVPLVLVVSLPCALLACASLRESHAKEAALSQYSYRQSAPALVGQLEQLLAAKHYPLRPYDQARHQLKTDWRCRGSTATWDDAGPPGGSECDFLVATVSQGEASAAASSVVISRWSWIQEPGLVPHAQESRAFDVEWAMLERLEPLTAQRVLEETRAQGGTPSSEP